MINKKFFIIKFNQKNKLFKVCPLDIIKCDGHYFKGSTLYL